MNKRRAGRDCLLCLAGLSCLVAGTAAAGLHGALAAVTGEPLIDSPAAYVRPARFEMGVGREDSHRNAYPQHWVTITRPFFMQRAAVTVAEFEAFVAATGHLSLAELEGESYMVQGGTLSDAERVLGVWWGEPGYEQGPDWPVTCVAFADALRFANWRSRREGYTPVYRFFGDRVTWDRAADGYRLPTEAEWELAARCGGECTVSSYDFSADLGPVGARLPNELGLYGMLDGALEWCWDGFEAYATEARTDPVGVDPEDRRVIRGQSPHRREWATERFQSNRLGFRLARNAPALPDDTLMAAPDSRRRAELLGLIAEQEAVARKVRRRHAEASLTDSLVTETRARREKTRNSGAAISGVGIVAAVMGGAVVGSAATEDGAGEEDPDRVQAGETLALVGLGMAVLGGIIYLAAGQDGDGDYDEALQEARIILQRRDVEGQSVVGVRLNF